MDLPTCTAARCFFRLESGYKLGEGKLYICLPLYLSYLTGQRSSLKAELAGLSAVGFTPGSFVLARECSSRPLIYLLELKLQ